MPEQPAYADYNALVSALNQANPTEFKIGDNFFIQAQNVPDLWVYAVEATSSAYTYTDDETLVNALQTSGTIQVGYYTIAILESAKVDLSNFVPTSRTINGKTLTTDITLTAADIGAMTSDDTAAKATADAGWKQYCNNLLKGYRQQALSKKWIKICQKSKAQKPKWGVFISLYR